MTKRRKHPSDSRPIENPQDGAFLFMSDVPLAGYVLHERVDFAPAPNPWDDGRRSSESGPWLTERQPMGTQREFKRVAPLARPGLHRDFAALHARDDRAVLSFANEYGLLRVGGPLLLPGDGPRPAYYGESLARWRHECRTMRRLLNLWDEARGAANHGVPVDDDLSERIVWREGPRQVSVELPDAGAIIACEDSPAINAEVLADWTTHDLAAPARFYVADEVNRALHGAASPAVLPRMGSELAIVPHNLLAALYVLFANELSGRVRDLRACEYCGRYYYPGRSDQRFCGPSCRKKHHWHKGGTP